MWDKIAKNENIRDLEKSIQGAKLLSGISSLFGIQIDEDFDLLEKKILEIKGLADRFNEIFSSRGWIAHDSLDVEVMKKSVEQE